MVPNSVALAAELLAARRFGELFKKIGSLAFETRQAYGLKRDLTVAIPRPKAKIPISVRELIPSDIPILLPPPASIMRKERVELATRKAHLDASIPRCFVAVDDRNGAPCYFQWLMGPAQNSRIQALFGRNWFPILGADEALLENAYTPPAYRGNGIMSEAMALIAERASDMCCRYVVTFVERDNIASLKGCARSGFAPYVVRKERRLLRVLKSRTFEDMAGKPGE